MVPVCSPTSSIHSSSPVCWIFNIFPSNGSHQYNKKTFCIIMPYGFGSYINIDKLFVIINQKNHNNYHHG